MAKTRIPLDIDSSLKADFIERLEYYGKDHSYPFPGNDPVNDIKKRREAVKLVQSVKINTVLKMFMSYVVMMPDNELGEFLGEMIVHSKMYESYTALFEEVFVDPKEIIKSGNPFSMRLFNWLLQLKTGTMTEEEFKEKVEELRKGIAVLYEHKKPQ